MEGNRRRKEMEIAHQEMEKKGRDMVVSQQFTLEKIKLSKYCKGALKKVSSLFY